VHAMWNSYRAQVPSMEVACSEGLGKFEVLQVALVSCVVLAKEGSGVMSSRVHICIGSKMLVCVRLAQYK
jgi:hypothetical protein